MVPACQAGWGWPGFSLVGELQESGIEQKMNHILFAQSTAHSTAAKLQYGHEWSIIIFIPMTQVQNISPVRRYIY